MPFGMKAVDEEDGLAEEGGFAEHAVGGQSTSEVVDDILWSCSPVCEDGGEDVVSPFASGYAMETKTD